MCGGADVFAALSRFPGRNQSIHLKPYSKSAGYEPAIGEDDLPWEKILSWCETEGRTEWLVVEEDDLPWEKILSWCETEGRTEWLVVEYEMEKEPVDAVERSLAFLRKLRPR